MPVHIKVIKVSQSNSLSLNTGLHISNQCIFFGWRNGEGEGGGDGDKWRGDVEVLCSTWGKVGIG